MIFFLADKAAVKLHSYVVSAGSRVHSSDHICNRRECQLQMVPAFSELEPGSRQQLHGVYKCTSAAAVGRISRCWGAGLRRWITM
jgi:hypothetical protein